MTRTEIHRHAAYGPCRTVCGAFDCDEVDVAYAHDAERVTCSGCKGRDTSRRDYLARS